MARVTLDIDLSELEPTDRMHGYTAERLIRFAMVANAAGIKDADLKNFCSDTEKITETIRKEFDEIMRKALGGAL